MTASREVELAKLIGQLRKERREIQREYDRLDAREEALESELRRAEIELENLGR